MAVANTNLQNYNSELVQCIEDLKRKRDEVNRQIEQEERDKEKIQKEIALLQERLQRLKESLARKIHARSEYDKTIEETEGAYTKVCLFLSLFWPFSALFGSVFVSFLSPFCLLVCRLFLFLFVDFLSLFCLFFSFL
ncbi:13 kda deflagellation-inducible protein [Eimeria tenella]|uniref:13 kDa deflagellation-inducible protein n=1 Tax=Eimeria tenella TaxID=5802 RepID=C8TDQ7_EIMTE|nr:13 kda deflagellation-inducible protein [Eimeria tenella]